MYALWQFEQMLGFMFDFVLYLSGRFLSVYFLIDCCCVRQVLGTAVTKISKSAKDGYIDDFCESVRRFAAAVSRVIIITSQVSLASCCFRNMIIISSAKNGILQFVVALKMS